MGISKEEIDRINELSRKAKSETGLNEDELAERQKLRQKYIDSVRESLRGHLDNIQIKNEDGSITPLRKKSEK